MKALAKIIAAACMALVFGGYAYMEHEAEKDYVIETRSFVEVVRSGDTVDVILLQYYNKENERVEFDEFKFNTLHLPENKHLLNKYGGLKLIYPGDRITIIAKVKVAK